MHIKVNIPEILEALNKVKHIAKPDKVCPVFSNGVFETFDDEIKITVSNLINCAVIRVPAQIIEPGKCLIEIEKLTAILQTMSGDAFLEEKESVVWIKKDKTKCKLQKTNLSEYPETYFDDNKAREGELTVSIAAASLREGFIKTKGFTLDVEARILNGINIAVSGNIVKFIATDGNHLAYVIKTTETPDINTSVVIPAASAVALSQLIPDSGAVEMIAGNSYCVFDFGSSKFYTRLLEGAFPKVDQLIPKSFLTEFSLNKDELKKVLNRISVVEEKEDKCKVMFSLKGSFVTVETCGYKSNDVLTAEDKTGDDISFILNRCFIQTVLNSLSGTLVKFCLNGARSAVIFPDREHRYLVMPMA